MARKKKNNDNGMTGVMIVVVVILVLIAIVTPVAILIGYLFNAIKLDSIKKTLKGDMSDFWFDESEKQAFRAKMAQLQNVDTEIKQAHDKAVQAGISKNKDGSYSARSSIGKEVRSILDSKEPMKQSLIDSLRQIQQIPLNRWNTFNNYVRDKKAFFWSLLCWILPLAYFGTSLGKNSFKEILLVYWNMAYNTFWIMPTRIFGKEIEAIPMTQDELKMIGIATVVAIISFFVFRVIFKNSGKKYSPIPEIVTLENLDKY